MNISQKNTAELCIMSGLFAVVLIIPASMLLSSQGVFKQYSFPLFGALYICIAALIYAVSSCMANPILLMFLLYMILFYIMPGLFHVYMNKFPFYDPFYSSDVIFDAGLVVLLFCVFVLVGYSVFFKYFIIRVDKLNFVESIPVRFASEASGVVLICGLTSLMLALMIGLDYLNQSRGVEDARIEATPIMLVGVALCRTFAFLAVVYALILKKSLPNLKGSILLILSVLIFILSNNPSAVPRFIMAGYFLTLFFVFIDIARWRKFFLVVIFAVLQVTVFPLMSEISRGDASNIFNMDILKYYTTHGDFDGFQSTVSVVEMVNSSGVKYGINLLSAAFFYVPRSIWDSKSFGTGADAAIFMGFNFTNLSAPLPAEFFVDFYWYGLIILSAGLGFVFGVLDLFYEVYSRSGNRRRLIVISFVIGYIFIILRGSLVAVLGPVSVSIFLALIFEQYFKYISAKHSNE